MNKKELKEYWSGKTLEEVQDCINNLNRTIENQSCFVEDTLKKMQEYDRNAKYFLDRMLEMNDSIKRYLKGIKEDKEQLEIMLPILESKLEEQRLEAEANEPKFEVIKNFVEGWKVKTTEWYLDKLENGYNGDDKDILLILEQGEKAIKKILEVEAKNRLAKLIKQIKEKTGEVIECDLYVNTSCDGFDGQIVGEKRTVNINTILAGGWNIQKLHFRVLIK